jgi:hypothetical protein
LAQFYSSKTDDELLTLAADPYSLTEEARKILGEELRRRKLVRPAPIPKHGVPGDWGTVPGRIFRRVGAFCLNLVAAIFGTALIESPI